MRSFQLNKLVRDKIVLDMMQLGQQVTSTKLDAETFRQKLAEKLVEEAKEIDITHPTQALKELADMLEVIETLAAELGEDFDGMRELQSNIRHARGGFDQRLYVEKLGLADDDKWVDYYAQEPTKYPEVKGE
jgi:predicted house-cleaning noncanonical NTP pyrophosphatase (MazG superfamily)